MREHGGRNKTGDGIRVCGKCALELKIEISNLLTGARQGFIPEIGVPMIKELDDERWDRKRIGEQDPVSKMYYHGDDEWRSDKPKESGI